MNTKQLLRRTIIILAIVTVVTLGSWLFYVNVAQPELRVNAPKAATISLTTPDGVVVAKQDNTTKASFRVAPGTYVIRAETLSARELKYETVGFFEGKQTDFTFKEPLNAEPIAQAAAYNPSLQAGELLYFDPIKQHIQRMNALGDTSTVKTLDAGQDDDQSDAAGGGTYKALLIADGQMILNSYNRLLVIENGVAKSLNIEGIKEAINPLSINFGGNPTQASFVVAVDKAVYLYENADAKPQKLLDLPKTINQIAYGGNRAIAYSTDLAYSKQDVRSAYGSFAIDPIVIDTSTKSTYELSGPLVDATVSPDGKRAVLQARQIDHATVHDLENNRSLFSVEKPSLAAPLWVNSHEFVYERNKTVWRFNTDSKTASAIGILLRNAVSLTPEDNTHFLVSTFSHETSEAKALVYRLGDKQVAPSLIAASESTPISVDNYQVKFVNIDMPRLLIETTASTTNPNDVQGYRTKTQQLRQTALDDLQSKGINPADFTITFTPGDPL